MAREPRICAFKEDGTMEYAIDTMVKFPDRWAMVAGGSYRRHLACWPFGCRAFFSWCSCFAPAAASRYGEAVRGNDGPAARAVIEKYEQPFFDLAGGFPEGWQAVWRAAMELARVSRRYLRPPRQSLDEAETELVKSRLSSLGLLS